MPCQLYEQGRGEGKKSLLFDLQSLSMLFAMIIDFLNEKKNVASDAARSKTEKNCISLIVLLYLLGLWFQ